MANDSTAAEALFRAAFSGAVQRVATALQADPDLSRATDENSKTALHWAAEADRESCARLLLDAGAPLEARTSWGASAFDWAATMGSGRVAALLLSQGATGLTLITAAALGMRTHLQVLLESEIDPAVDRRRDAPSEPDNHWPPDSAHIQGDILGDALYAAGRNGHPGAVEILLAKGAGIDAKGVSAARAFIGRQSTDTERRSGSCCLAGQAAPSGMRDSMPPRLSGPAKAVTRRWPTWSEGTSQTGVRRNDRRCRGGTLTCGVNLRRGGALGRSNDTTYQYACLSTHYCAISVRFDYWTASGPRIDWTRPHPPIVDAPAPGAHFRERGASSLHSALKPANRPAGENTGGVCRPNSTTPEEPMPDGFDDIACHVFAIDGFVSAEQAAAVNADYAATADDLGTQNNAESRALALEALVKAGRQSDLSGESARIYGGFRRGQKAPEHMWVEYKGQIYDTMPGRGLVSVPATAETRACPGCEEVTFGSGAVFVETVLTEPQLANIRSLG